MKTILAVDDSASVRHMVKITLSAAGYQVIEAGDGREGLAQAQDNSVAMILTDLNMPVMNGIRLMEEIGALNAGVKFILLTAFSDHAALTSRESSRIRIDHTVMKPVDYLKLLVAVQQCLPCPEVPPPAAVQAPRLER